MTCSEIKKYIYSNNKVPNVLEALGCHHIRIWDNRVTCCNPDGDNQLACNVYLNENLNVVNYTRNLSEVSQYHDILTLIQFYKKCDFRETMVWIHRLFNISLNYTNNSKEEAEENDLLGIFPSLKRKSKVKHKENIKIDESELFNSIPYPHKDFVIDACISSKTIKKFELGYNVRTQRTIIPCRSWKDGSLIGIRGRTSIADADKLGIAKYLPLKAFSTGQELYGLWENYNEIVESKKVIIFEGEKSVLKLDSLYKRFSKLTDEPAYGVAIYGHNVSLEQATILGGIGIKEVTIAFDNDVDLKTIKKSYLNFYPGIRVYYLHDEKEILGPKDSPIDKDIKDFTDMYNKRHKYNCADL